MAGRFEELRAWQAARRVANQVYELIRHAPFARDFALTDQIRRASISTMNNVAEGFDAGSPVEFARFLRYASRSASEVQSCLYLARDQGYVTDAEFARVYDQAANVRRLCGALAKALRCSASAPRPRRDRVGDRPPPPYRRSESPPAPRPRPPATLFPTAPATGHRPLAPLFRSGR